MKQFLVSACLLSLVLACTGCPGGDKGNGSADRSAKLLKRIEKLLKSDDPAEMATKLPNLAVRQAEELKDKPGAMKTMDAALGACAKIDDFKQQSEAYAKIAEGYGKLGEKSNAKRTLKRALEALEKLGENTSPEEKIKLQVTIAKAQAAMADTESADETLTETMKVIAGLAHVAQKVDALCEVGECYGVMKSDAGMKKVEAAVRALTEDSEDARTKSDNLARVAAVQFKTGMKEAGEATLKEAAEIADSMTELGRKAMALCQLVEQALKVDMGDLAKEMIDKADYAAEHEKDNALRAQAREEVGKTKKLM